MNHINLTNENIWHTDFSRKERIDFLSSLNEPKSQKTAIPAIAITTQGIHMTYVPTGCKGSIKSRLESQGGYRVPWWRLNCFVDRIFNPSATDFEILEAIEQRQNLKEIELQRRVAIHQMVANTIRQDGYIKGLCCACRQMSFR